MKPRKSEKCRLKKVLVIDDDEEYNFLTEDTFKEAGIKCGFEIKTLAKDALDFLDSSKPAFPNLILLDINMPVINGWEFLDEYQHRNFSNDQTVIAMMSSSIYPEDREKALSYNDVLAYIDKPLTTAELEQLLDKYFIVEKATQKN